jgi:omega-6 fatty acid desaturase (delta-12 desaturase)
MMLSGKELILATKGFAKEIRWKSWFHTLSTLFLLIASLLGTYFAPFLIGRIICSVASALLLSRFFIIFHDYQHHTILNKSRVANVLFTIFGSYMITPPSIWKRSHDHHHNHNAKLFSASIGSFPIMTRQKFEEATPKERAIYLFTRSPINMVCSYFTMFLYGMCLQSFISSPKRHLDSLLIIILHLTVATSLWIYFGPLTWFLTFFLPFFLSHMLGAYLFYAQHNFPGVKFKPNTAWNYSSAALESSSYMKMNPFWRWVTANIGYHHIHHLNSRIPFYRLPEVMNKFPELQKATITTLNPSDIAACLRLKVWDPERDEMIGFKEMSEPAVVAPVKRMEQQSATTTV